MMEILADLLGAYQLPILLAGSFLIADSFIVAAGLAAGGGALSPLTVYVICLIGVVLSDAAWFAAGEPLLGALSPRKPAERSRRRLRAFDALVRKRFVLTLLLSKILYGTRVLMILYLSKRMRFRRFMAWDALITAAWVALIVAVGYGAGRGIMGLMLMFNTVGAVVTTVVVLVIIFRVLTWALSAGLESVSKKKGVK